MLYPQPLGEISFRVLKSSCYAFLSIDADVLRWFGSEKNKVVCQSAGSQVARERFKSYDKIGEKSKSWNLNLVPVIVPDLGQSHSTEPGLQWGLERVYRH